MNSLLTVNIPEALHKSLEERAKARLVSKSALVRMVLADFLQANSEPTPAPTEAHHGVPGDGKGVAA